MRLHNLLKVAQQLCGWVRTQPHLTASEPSSETTPGLASPSLPELINVLGFCVSVPSVGGSRR